MDPRIVHRKRVVAARAERERPRVTRELEAARALLARREPESNEILDIVAERIARDLERLEPKRGVVARLLGLGRGEARQGLDAASHR